MHPEDRFPGVVVGSCNCRSGMMDIPLDTTIPIPGIVGTKGIHNQFDTPSSDHPGTDRTKYCQRPSDDDGSGDDDDEDDGDEVEDIDGAGGVDDEDDDDGGGGGNNDDAGGDGDGDEDEDFDGAGGDDDNDGDGNDDAGNGDEDADGGDGDGDEDDGRNGSRGDDDGGCSFSPVYTMYFPVAASMAPGTSGPSTSFSIDCGIPLAFFT
ncbi:GSCOCG00000039001-RA-CDS [Cotesia congregata]|nr:GSCOCG00000039001-RA-CDS [Cotesia congregata]